MKNYRFLLSILALVPVHLFAATGDIRLSRQNESGTWVDVIIPASTSSLIGFDGSGLPAIISSVSSFTATDFTVTNPFNLGTPASGNLTNCTAATQPPGNNSTKLATTAYVTEAVAAGGGGTSIPGMLSLWPTANIGNLPAGWQSCDGTNGTSNMTATQGANFVTPLNTTGSAPTFSPVAGTYTGTQTVTISADPGYSIWYNTTGSPTRASTLYTSPVSVSASSTLYAVTGKDPSLLSLVGSAAYVVSTIFDQNTQPKTDFQQVGQTANSIFAGQRAYTPASPIIGVDWVLSKYGTDVTGITYTCQIWTEVSGNMGTLVATSTAVTGNNSWNNTTVHFTFASPIAAGTSYCIVLTPSTAPDSVNYIAFNLTDAGGISGFFGAFGSAGAVTNSFGTADAKITLYTP